MDGRIKQTEKFEVGDSVYLTGDKVGIVKSIEHKLHTPEPQTGDGKGNVYSRVLGKSERYVETMLYVYTENEVIKNNTRASFLCQWRLC